MRVVVCGSRNWIDTETVWRVLSTLKEEITKKGGKVSEVTIVHGDCRGADKIADKEGRSLGFKIEKHPANWTKYGKAAGPIRNLEMLETLKSGDRVIAFWDTKSRGTKHTIEHAEQIEGVTVDVWTLTSKKG